MAAWTATVAIDPRPEDGGIDGASCCRGSALSTRQLDPGLRGQLRGYGRLCLGGLLHWDITENSVLLAIHLVNAQWLQALSCLVAVIDFLAGTAGGVIWPRPPGGSACRHLAPVLALEIALIALGMTISVLAAKGRNDVFLVSLYLALGCKTVHWARSTRWHSTRTATKSKQAISGRKQTRLP